MVLAEDVDLDRHMMLSSKYAKDQLVEKMRCGGEMGVSVQQATIGLMENVENANQASSIILWKKLAIHVGLTKFGSEIAVFADQDFT